MPPSNVELLDAWHRVPLSRRIAILVASVIETDRAAVPAIENLVSLVAVMAKELSPEQRKVIVERLRVAAAELAASSDRHALH